MSSTDSPFDKQAADWDTDKFNVEASSLFLQAIQSRFVGLANGDEKGKRAIEIGCGTGLLSVQLAPILGGGDYLCFDPSKRMMDVLEAKIPHLPPGTSLKVFRETLIDPESPRLGGRQVDYVFSHLTLHHLPDIKASIDCLAKTLASGGHMVLSDFEASAESMHSHHTKQCHHGGPGDDPHKHHGPTQHGSVLADIKAMMVNAGLEEVKVEHSFDLLRSQGDEVQTKYKFFICTGRKP